MGTFLYYLVICMDQFDGKHCVQIYKYSAKTSLAFTS